MSKHNSIKRPLRIHTLEVLEGKLSLPQPQGGPSVNQPGEPRPVRVEPGAGGLGGGYAVLTGGGFAVI